MNELVEKSCRNETAFNVANASPKDQTITINAYVLYYRITALNNMC